MPNTSLAIAALTALNANQTNLTRIALTKSSSNRDIVVMLRKGILSVDGDGVWSGAFSTQAQFFVWCRNRATKQEIKELHSYLFKSSAGRRNRTKLFSGINTIAA